MEKLKISNSTAASEKMTSPRILFKLIEQNGCPFRTLITRMYDANPASPGLLVFPIYSPRQLHFDRAKFQTTADVRSYGDALVQRLERDVGEHLKKTLNLRAANIELMEKLIEAIHAMSHQVVRSFGRPDY